MLFHLVDDEAIHNLERSSYYHMRISIFVERCALPSGYREFSTEVCLAVFDTPQIIVPGVPCASFTSLYLALITLRI